MPEVITSEDDVQQTPVEGDGDDRPFALQEPPIGKPKPKAQPTGKRTVRGVWVVYRQTRSEAIAGALLADEVDALREVAKGKGESAHIFVPWGSSLAEVLAPVSSD